MASIRTPEQIKQMLEERKRIQQRKKEREKIKYKKASEAIKKALQHNSPPKENKCNQEPKYNLYDVPVYNSNYVQREPAEEDLYQTREELMQAEKRMEGEINWEVWQQLIDKLK